MAAPSRDTFIAQLEETRAIRRRAPTTPPPPPTPPPEPPSGRGDGPHNGPMHERVERLEKFADDSRERLARMEAKLDSFSATFATKEDLHRELHSQTWRFVGAVTTIGIAVIGAMVWIAKNIR